MFAIDALRDLDPPPKIATLADAARARRSVALGGGARGGAAAVREARSGARAAASSRTDARRQEARQAAARRGGARVGRGRDAGQTRTPRRNALDGMLKDDDADVRAAAADGGGQARPGLSGPAVKMAKAENYNVRIGAARGPREHARSPAATRAIGSTASRSCGARRAGRAATAAKIFAHLAKQEAAARAEDYLERGGAHAGGSRPAPDRRRGAVQRRARGQRRGAAQPRALRSTTRRSRCGGSSMHCVADGPDPGEERRGIAQQARAGSRQRDPRGRGARARAVRGRRARQGWRRRSRDALVTAARRPRSRGPA